MIKAMARISPDKQASELAARRYNAGQLFKYYYQFTVAS